MIKLYKIGILILFAVILSAPIILLSQNFNIQKPADILFFIHRISGLYAFSLIFIAIIIGSAMSPMGRIFPPDKIFIIHQLIGKLAFVLAITHPIILFTTFIFEHNLNYITPFLEGTNIFYFSFGTLSFLLLILTVGAALLRFRIGLKWIYIHRLNYLIFWLIFFHSLALGVDLQSQPAKLLYISYGIIVGFLTTRRFFTR